MRLSYWIVHKCSYKEGVLKTIHTIPAHFNTFIPVNVDLLMSYVLIMHHIYVRSTFSAHNINTICPQELFWVLLQLQSVGYFLPRETFWEVVLWSGLGFVQSNIPEGTVCFLRVRRFFSLLNFTSWILLTVTLLCLRRSSQYYCVLTGSYFHSASRAKAGWGEDLH